MMRKTILVCIALVAVLVSALNVRASESDGSLGVKLWSNTWKETVKPEGGVARDFDNGTVLLAGPSFNVRFSRDWFAGITYLAALHDYESSNWIASGDKMKFDAKNLDIIAGYLLHDPMNDLKVGFFVQYKVIVAPAFYTNQSAGLNNVDAGKWKLWGPGLGILIQKPLDRSTLLYGTISYLFLEEEFAFSSGGMSRFDTDGWSMEFALSRAFSDEISANLGIKFELFKGEKDNGDHINDSFSGLTGGIKYTF